MNPRELELVKLKFCEDNRIVDQLDKVAMQQVGMSRRKQAVFIMTVPGRQPFHYEVEKVDLAPMSDIPGMAIPKEYRTRERLLTNKGIIAEWVNRFTGLRMIESDIAYLSPSKTHLNVIVAADSMRFKSDFRLIRL